MSLFRVRFDVQIEGLDEGRERVLLGELAAALLAACDAERAGRPMPLVLVITDTGLAPIQRMDDGE